MKKPKRLYIVCFLIPCLLLSNGFAQEYVSQWHLPEGAKARLGRGKLNNIIFSPDGTRVAVSTSIGIWVYDAHTTEAVSLFTGIQTGEKEKFLPTRPPEALTFSADAILIASAHGNSIYVWDTATGTAFAILDEHPDSIKALALSPDSAKLATAAGDWTVRLWEVGTGKYLNSLTGHPSAVNAVAFSPDGKILASAGSSLRLWDANTGELLHTDNNDLGSISKVVFAADGNTLATGGGWYRTAHLWDVKTGTLQKSLKGHTGKIRDIAFSPDSRTLVTALEKLSTVPTEPGRLYWPLVFSPDGKILVSSGGESRSNKVTFWQTDPGAPLFTLEGHASPVTEYAFSSDSKIFASGSEDAAVVLWDVKTGNQLATLTGHTKRISTLAFSADSKTLASGSGNEIRLWNVYTAALIARLDAMENVDALAFAPDDKTLTSGVRNGIIQVWKLGITPQVVSTLRSHHGLISMLMFSPDGKTLASGGADGTILLWDTQQ
ncbi:hypothetical protein F4054_11160 [Candidatus Poribacteria bacterium]|nr:hypothetical protein [Candidatus Poribacteria bacterium]MYG07002.1 hypothetical protein [Candidatus Poribacteria bacterium]MYK22802.1 hypothetical protein [Candidatus Poribacteria bacterium]